MPAPPPPSVVPLSALSPSPASLPPLFSSCSSFLQSPQTLPAFEAALTSLPGLSPKQQKAAGKCVLLLLPYCATHLTASAASVGPLLSSLDEPFRGRALEALLPEVAGLAQHLSRGGHLPVYDSGGLVKGGGDKVSLNSVVGLSWSFGVTSATSELAQVGQTYLQLAIETREEGGEVKTTVLETDVKGLYQLMAEVERARQAMAIVEGTD